MSSVLFSRTGGTSVLSDADGDSTIDALAVDDRWDFAVGGSDVFHMDGTSGFYAANASGPALVNETAGETNPTLIPSRGSLATGWGSTLATNMTAVLAGKLAYRLGDGTMLMQHDDGAMTVNFKRDEVVADGTECGSFLFQGLDDGSGDINLGEIRSFVDSDVAGDAYGHLDFKALNDSTNLTMFSLGPSGISFPTGGEETISSGVINIRRVYHTVAAETGTTDQLDQILDEAGGTSRLTAGQILILSPAPGDTITVADAAGKIRLDAAGNFAMNSHLDRLMLMFHSAAAGWVELSRSDNA